jgi:hypothetical protein
MNWRIFRYLMTAAGSVLLSLSGRAQDENVGHQRIQDIPLQVGWNAVFLEVEPLDPSPQVVFGALPVDRVATLFQGPTTNQFVTDPGVDLFKGRGWGVWYAAKQPEAFLKSLASIEGNRAYLVHAKTACVWKISGTVKRYQVDWKPDAFNLVGFSVRSTGGPTFAEFFAGSKAHKGQVIYRMVEGRWKQVIQPSAESMRSGEAFWIKCDGASDFQGPLRVETSSSQGLELKQGVSELVLRNECPHPLASTLRHVPTDSSPLPLSILVRTYGDPSAPVRQVAARMPAGAWEQDLPPLEIGASMSVPFEVRPAEFLRARQGSLLKITTDIGTETWIPLSGFRDDLGQ